MVTNLSLSFHPSTQVFKQLNKAIVDKSVEHRIAANVEHPKKMADEVAGHQAVCNKFDDDTNMNIQQNYQESQTDLPPQR